MLKNNGANKTKKYVRFVSNDFVFVHKRMSTHSKEPSKVNEPWCGYYIDYPLSHQYIAL